MQPVMPPRERAQDDTERYNIPLSLRFIAHIVLEASVILEDMDSFMQGSENSKAVEISSLCRCASLDKIFEMSSIYRCTSFQISFNVQRCRLKPI